MNIQPVTFKNNLNGLLVDSPGSTSATVQIWFRTGSALEEKKDHGIAHFLEHMFFKGTNKRPGAKIAYDVESEGSEINAFTSFDFTCYYINCPNTSLKRSVEIIMDMVANPKFDTKEIIPERGVVLEEYKRSQDSPSQYAFQKMQTLCFNKGFSHPILGNKKTINSFNRKQLITFRNKHYNLSNSLLLIAGDLNNNNNNNVHKIVEKYTIPKGPKTKFPPFKLKNKSSIQVHKKNVAMCTLTICMDSSDFISNQAPAEDLAIGCLGQGETSRLYKNLVLKDTLANSSSSSTMFMNEGGAHFIKIVFPKENVDKVFNILLTTLSEVILNGFTQEEIKRVKNQYISSKIYEKESIESYAFSLGHSYAQNGNINSESEFIDKMKSFSVKEINSSIREIFDRTMHFVLQVPSDSSIQVFEKKLLQLQEKCKSQLINSKSKKNKSINYAKCKHDPQVKIIKLKDGVKLFYRQNTMTPTFIFHTYIKGGLTDEHLNSNGSYHLISSLLTSGNKNFDREQLKIFFENRSASFSGFTGKNAYGLTLHGKSDDFYSMLPNYFNSLFYPSFEENDFFHEKEITMRLLQNQAEDPIRQCFNLANKIMFTKHPYAMNVLGNSSSLNSIQLNSLRQTHQKNLKNKSILFTYCGDKSLEDIHEKIMPLVNHLRPRKTPNKTSLKKYSPLKGVNKFIELVREQTQIFIGIPTDKMIAKENIFLKIINAHLSGQSSDLFVDVRDKKGLCYNVQPVHFTALEGGYWGVYLACSNAKVKMAIEAVNKILTDIKNNGLNKSQFIRTKKIISGQSLINIQTNEDYASVYSIPFLHGHGANYYYNNLETIESLSYEEFQKGIQKVFKRQWNQVIVGKHMDN